METEYALNSIFHIAKADVLQRVRSYYFLIALGVCVFIIYSFVPPVDAKYTMVTLGNYRGYYNSAWIGSMVSMCVPFFVLIGFYLINNAVRRDIDTGVGQIIATTRITKFQYLLGKFVSNFLVLLVMLMVIAVMTVAMFLVRGEDNHLEPGKLLLPLLILTVPAMFILAALALFFDSLPNISRGFVNIAYFFLWIFLVSSSLWSPAFDVFGVNTALLQIKNDIAAVHPDWNGSYGTGIIIRDSLSSCMVFRWEGMNWTIWIFLQRLMWMGAAMGLVVFASLWFNRFDASDSKERKERKKWFAKKIGTVAEVTEAKQQITIRDLPPVKAGFNFFSLVKAELLLMLRGNPNLWLIFTAGLFVASVFTPLFVAYQFLLPLLWFLQILNLSKIGSREITNRCHEYIFSAASPLRRQLPATLTAAVTILLALSLPVMTRVLFYGNIYGAYAILAGAMFVASFALTSGILTGGSKLFEVMFTLIVYGILNEVPFFDFIGAVQGSRELGMVHYLLLTSLVLIVAGFFGRKRQICCSN